MVDHTDATLTALPPVVEPGSVTIGIAIAVPDPCGIHVKSARENYGDPQARAIPTHVTLLPPVMVSPTMLDDIDLHLRSAAARIAPFRIALHGSASFRPVSPVVFLALNEGIAGCEALERVVRSGPLLRRRNFPYHPHVTLVHDLPESVLDAAFQDFSEYQFAFTAASFTLYEQDADRVWQPVREYSLGS
jgi:2'-5' RNA ligase